MPFSDRLRILQRLKLLDAEPEEAFDRLTRLVTRVLEVPISLVSLVADDRQVFKSCVGLPEPWASRRQTPLSFSLCQHEVMTGEPLIITDGRGHPLMNDNPAIEDLGVVAYAGIPLRTSDGHVLGSFCAIDTQPRTWTPEELSILADLAGAAMTEIERRAAVREAEEARSQVLSILESIADVFVAVDADWHFVYLNDDAECFFGRNRAELTAGTLWSVLPASDGIDCAAEFRRARQEHVPASFEAYFPVLRSWYDVRVYPAQDGLSLHARDITERKRIETALREAEERLTFALTAGRLGSWYLDLATRDLSSSAICKANFGRRPADPFSYDDLFEAIRPDHRDHVRATVERAINERVDYDAEYPITWPDGTEHWILARGRCRYDEAGVPLFLTGITIDLTERRELELAQQRQEELLRALLEHFPNGWVVALDCDLHYLLAEGQALAYLGLTPERFVGQTFGAVFPPESVEVLRPYYQRALAGESVQFELPIAGRVFQVDVVPLGRDGRAVDGIFAAAQDISALREFQQQKQAFLAAAAHDVKTPLTTIKGFVQLLLRKARREELPAWVGEDLQKIEDAARKTITLLDDLVDLACLEMKQPLELERRTVDLERLVRDVALQHQTGTDRHQLQVQVSAAGLFGYWDPVRLERVLDNLLSNAIKYSPAGGMVLVCLEEENDETGDWAVIRVTDAGIGIPADALPRLSERFFRATNAAGDIPGTGLGLAGVRDILEQHGGSIAVASTEGVGSTFTVRLPLSGGAG